MSKNLSTPHMNVHLDQDCRDSQPLLMVKKMVLSMLMVALMEVIVTWIHQKLKTLLIVLWIIYQHVGFQMIMCQMDNVGDRVGQWKELVIAPIQHYDCKVTSTVYNFVLASCYVLINMTMVNDMTYSILYRYGTDSQIEFFKMLDKKIEEVSKLP